MPGLVPGIHVIFRCDDISRAWPVKPGHDDVAKLDPGSPARLVSVDDRPGATAGWSLHALPTAPGYTAALVVEGDVEVCVRGRWDA